MASLLLRYLQQLSSLHFATQCSP